MFKASTVRIIQLLLLVASITSSAVFAVDLSNPINLVFAADKRKKLIDVIDTRKSEVVFRINTDYLVDGLVATPYAPLLFFTNKQAKVVVVYNLKEKEVDTEIKLSMVPRHMVLDTTGKQLGISDSQSGGIAILSAYARKIVYQNKDFPATEDLLFDPNEVELYYTNNKTGSIGLLNLNTYETSEYRLVEQAEAAESGLGPPSRSLDGRYIYIADQYSGDIFSLNSFSGIVYKTFYIGESPARPYTTPDGLFLYMLDADSGRFVSVEQQGFTQYADTTFGQGIDLVTVGRFDRMNLLLSSKNTAYYIYDNFNKSIVKQGKFSAIPLDAQGSIDGKKAYIAFRDSAQVAVVDLEKQQIDYIKATDNGSRAFSIGATNNVCH